MNPYATRYPRTTVGMAPGDVAYIEEMREDAYARSLGFQSFDDPAFEKFKAARAEADLLARSRQDVEDPEFFDCPECGCMHSGYSGTDLCCDCTDNY